MKKNDQPRDQERREFIRKSTLVGAGVAAATVTATPVIADSASPSDEPRKQKGYQLTQHVLDYYKSADL